MEPVYLRHKDATRQAVLYGTFGSIVTTVVLGGILLDFPGKWWFLILAPFALFLVYSAVRLATLKVRVDAIGVWEPNPFRLTYVTPWADVREVRKTTTPGAMKMRFVGVEIVHADRDTHEIAALKMQAGAAYAEPTVDDWVEQMRDAKRRAAAL